MQAQRVASQSFSFGSFSDVVIYRKKMFKFVLIAVIAFIAGAQAVSNPNDVHAQVVKSASQVNEDGSYHYDYATSNGISAQEDGIGGHHASGGFAYYSPEGQLIQLSYLADENGFQPQGDHLPTPPPIPPQILKALEYIRTHPYTEPAHQQQHQAFGRRHY